MTKFWRTPGRTERRLALAILFTAVLPLTAAIVLVNSLFRQASSVWFNPEIGRQLDRGVVIYKDYVRAIKDDLKHETEAIALDESLVSAVAEHRPKAAQARLTAFLQRYPNLVSVSVENGSGDPVVRKERGAPFDAKAERTLDVRRPLGADPQSGMVVATFAVEGNHPDELEKVAGLLSGYHGLEASRGELYQGYLQAFAALVVLTALITVALGTLLARGVTRRINRLAAAIDVVKRGDLSVRVPVTGSDELTELARVFNEMLAEMSGSRARIEFLQRVGAWQEMARRLAHEIKNPLTPIQLAVQECHRKYEGDDKRFKSLLDTTLEIVEEEVGTLRRLVGHFSSFAQLPTPQLEDTDLREFFADCADQFEHLRSVQGADDFGASDPHPPGVDVTWHVPTSAVVASVDRQLLRLSVGNLVRNAVQAIQGAGRSEGTVDIRVEVQPSGAVHLSVEDDGPGVSQGLHARIFEPYFTTKEGGSGIGLAIVKKVVVEHGGSIDVDGSERLDGARFTIHLPPRAAVLSEADRHAREAARRAGVALEQAAGG